MTSHFNTCKNFVLCYAAKISAKKCCTFFKLPFNYKSELVSICMALSYRIYDPSYLQFIMVHPQLYMGICIQCYDNSFSRNSMKSDFLSISLFLITILVILQPSNLITNISLFLRHHVARLLGSCEYASRIYTLCLEMCS